MKKHIIELLQEQRVKKLQRAEQYANHKEKVLNSKAEAVKRILRGDKAIEGLSITASHLRDLYYDRLRAYKGENYSYDPGVTKAGTRLWERVEKAFNTSDVDPERFIKAQFAFFDKAFGKAPEITQLATQTAVDRAREYEGLTEGRVLSNARKAPITKADTYRQSELMIQQIMAAQKMTRVEVYQKLVANGLVSLPPEFMERDPAYIAAKATNDD